MTHYNEQLAPRYPDAARKIVEASAGVRAALIEGKVDLSQCATVDEMVIRLAWDIATDQEPDVASPRHRVMWIRKCEGTAAYAYPQELREIRVLEKWRQAAG